MTDAVVTSIEHVTHRYGKTFALNDLSLDIPANCMAGLIGPDGVGKSTLLALIAGVRKIQTGKVIVLDGDMADEKHRRASYGRIAYMPQGLGRNLYPTLSVFDNIDFFGRLFGQGSAERRGRIDELLKATGLDPFGDRPCGKLSGGMKQKVSLCCSLMHDPDLLILDEPTTGVDPLSRRQFWELIDSIRVRRPMMSVIVATAYMDEASRFNWLATMDDGKVIAHGARRRVRKFVTAGSQSSFFYEINALPTLPFGTSLPDDFPDWLNFWILTIFSASSWNQSSSEAANGRTFKSRADYPFLPRIQATGDNPRLGKP